MAWKKFIAGFDSHGDKQHNSSVAAFHKFIGIWKPTIRVMGGDAFDLRPLRKRASEDEKRESMKADFDAGMRFLSDFKPTHYLRGNHCQRLWDLALQDNGIASDYALQGIAEIEGLVKKMNCTMFDYHKRTGIVRLGHLKILHGFYSGVYASRQMAQTYGSCLFGHVHGCDEHAIPGIERRVARACGCLCELDMEYNARQPGTLRHAHGFAFGVVNSKTGDYHVWQAEEVNGTWIVPSDIVTL